MPYTCCKISQIGTSHLEREKGVCQDYSKVKRFHPGFCKEDDAYIIAAIADGVGSCAYSQFGAKIAVDTVIHEISHKLASADKKVTDDEIFKMFQSAFEAALDNVTSFSDEDSFPKEHGFPLDQFDSTLTAALFDGTTLWFSHIGDDGIVVLYTDGSYEMITTRLEGEEPSSVVPLRVKSAWQIGKAPKPVAAAALLTDGLLDANVGDTQLHNRIYVPFFEPLLAQPRYTDEEMKAFKKELAQYLEGGSDHTQGIRKTVRDDITIAIIQNPDAAAAAPKLPFDQARWDKETDQFLREANYRLYPQFYNPDGSEKKTASLDEIIDPWPAIQKSIRQEQEQKQEMRKGRISIESDNTDTCEAKEKNIAQDTAPQEKPAEKKASEQLGKGKEKEKTGTGEKRKNPDQLPDDNAVRPGTTTWVHRIFSSLFFID